MRAMLNRAKDFLVSSAVISTVGVFVAMFVLIAIGFGVARGSSTQLDEVGGSGQACYPNSTCQPDLTCFSIQEKPTCLRDVKPVINTRARQCYTYIDKDKQEHTPCFETETECLISFGRNLKDASNDLIQACHYIKE